MLNQDQAADIFERVKKHSTADEVEVLFSGGKSALTRFANNTIHQNVAEENYIVSVRTVFGGRTARADDQQTRRRKSQAGGACVGAVWREFNIQILTCCPCRNPVGRTPPPAKDDPHGISPKPRRSLRHCARTRFRRSFRSRGAQTNHGRHRLLFGIGGRSFQFSRAGRLAHADVVGSFNHHACTRFLGMAEGQFSGRQQP